MSNLGYARSIADLTGRIGEARAQGHMGSVGAWAQGIQQIPQNLMAIMDMRDQRGQRAEQQKIRDMQMRGLERDEAREIRSAEEDQQIRALYPLLRDDPAAMAREAELINPEKAEPIRQRATAEQNALRGEINRWTGSILSLPADKRPEAWTRFKGALAGSKMPAAAQLPDAYDEGFARELYVNSLSEAQRVEFLKPQKVETETITSRNPDGTETIEIVEKKPGVTRTTTPKPARPNQPVERLVDGRKRDVVWGEDGNWYFPGDLKKPIAASRVQPVPDKAGEDDRITPAMKATAERWRADQLNQLEDTRRRSRGVDAFGVPIPPMSDQEYNDAKARIDAAYRDSLGLPAPPAAAAPTRGRAMVNSLRRPPAGVTPPVVLAAPRTPAAPAPPAASAPAAPARRTTTKAAATAAAQSLGMPVEEYVRQLAARGVTVVP